MVKEVHNVPAKIEKPPQPVMTHSGDFLLCTQWGDDGTADDCYLAIRPIEMSIQRDEYVELHECHESGWSFGRKLDEYGKLVVGWFPSWVLGPPRLDWPEKKMELRSAVLRERARIRADRKASVPPHTAGTVAQPRPAQAHAAGAMAKAPPARLQ